MIASDVLLRAGAVARSWRKPGILRSVVRTAGFNAIAMAASGVAGIVLARSIGPTGRGEYAAITSWFGLSLLIGDIGQPAAICYYVSRDRGRAASYVATSRSMMLVSGSAAMITGLLMAASLGHHDRTVVYGYQIMFATSAISFIGTSYTFSLQATAIRQWNYIRATQPVLMGLAVVAMWASHTLNLIRALFALSLTMSLQLCWAYYSCRHAGLAPGRTKVTMIRPLVIYGLAQIAAIAPATINADLDQLILSQTIPSADLGRYAVAVSLTTIPVALVAAIGNVTFPHIAAQGHVTVQVRSLQRRAVGGSLLMAGALLVPLALLAHWLVPLVYGSSYQAAVPLVWILAPGAIFLAGGQVVGDILRGRNHPGTVAWSQGIAAAVTILLLIALLPRYGATGAAVASTAAYGIAFAAMTRRLFHLPRHSRGTAPDIPVSEPASAPGHRRKRVTARSRSELREFASANPPRVDRNSP